MIGLFLVNVVLLLSLFTNVNNNFSVNKIVFSNGLPYLKCVD